MRRRLALRWPNEICLVCVFFFRSSVSSRNNVSCTLRQLWYVHVDVDRRPSTAPQRRRRCGVSRSVCAGPTTIDPHYCRCQNPHHSTLQTRSQHMCLHIRDLLIMPWTRMCVWWFPLTVLWPLCNVHARWPNKTTHIKSTRNESKQHAHTHASKSCAKLADGFAFSSTKRKRNARGDWNDTNDGKSLIR